MSTETVVLTDKGRLVLPARLRARYGWQAGTRLIITDNGDGELRLTSPQQALSAFRDAVKGTASAADELIQDRRLEAVAQ